MRSLGLLCVVLSATFFGLTEFSPLKHLSTIPSDAIELDHRINDESIRRHEAQATLPQGGRTGLDRLRTQRMWLASELLIRRFKCRLWFPWVGGVGGVLFLLSFVRVSGRGVARRKTRSIDAVSDVNEDPPSEVYVDDLEFERKVEGGFAKREEAVAWLLQDPLLTCDYCGADLHSTFSSGREAVQLVTFYKKVPEGAKDLRIVLGSYWFARAASELKCESCNRIVRR